MERIILMSYFLVNFPMLISASNMMFFRRMVYIRNIGWRIYFWFLPLGFIFILIGHIFFLFLSLIIKYFIFNYILRIYLNYINIMKRIMMFMMMIIMEIFISLNIMYRMMMMINRMRSFYIQIIMETKHMITMLSIILLL